MDAPELQDDFYLNLVDWSSLNVLSVGLGTCVYLWSACTSQVNDDQRLESDVPVAVGVLQLQHLSELWNTLWEGFGACNALSQTGR